MHSDGSGMIIGERCGIPTPLFFYLIFCDSARSRALLLFLIRGGREFILHKSQLRYREGGIHERGFIAGQE